MSVRDRQARRVEDVWVHVRELPTQGIPGLGPLHEAIESAQLFEWRETAQTHRSAVEAVRTSFAANARVTDGVTWSEVVDNVLQLAPGEAAALRRRASGLLAAHRDALERLWELADAIVSRRTVIALDGDAAGADGGPLEPWILQASDELAASANTPFIDKVAFVRLTTPGAEKSGEHGVHGDAFDRLMRALMSRMTSVSTDDYVLKEGARLLSGETGAGKTEMARALHQRLVSQTGRRGHFVSVNIAAVGLELLESRLRGFEKGSFTGAFKEQKGWFELADGGTLFLDELQAAPTAFQVQLLDLLSAVSDNVEVARIGAADATKHRCCVRVVMATNEDEAALLKVGRWRRDLAFRIRARIHLKPLRDRIRSQPGLLEGLLRLHRWRSAAPLPVEKLAPDRRHLTDALQRCFLPPIHPATRERLTQHAWPGNLREFERVCFDAFLEFDRSGSVDWDDHFRQAIGSVGPGPDVDTSGDEEAIVTVVRGVERILVENHFNVRASQGALAVYRLKSPPALKRFLALHVDRLTLSQWSSRKAQSLLGR